MNTNAAATETTNRIRRSNVGTTGAATWTIQPWTDRTPITAEYKPWAAGLPCMAITRTGNDCDRRGTHITPNQTVLCQGHANAKYAVDCR